MREQRRDNTPPYGGWLAGVPASNVLAIPKMDVVGSLATKYEARTAGRVVVVSRQNPAERAVNVVLRPKTTFIELGPYHDGNYDLITMMFEQRDGYLVNGRHKKVNGIGTIGAIADVAKRRGVQRMVTHELDPRLEQIALDMGLELREKAHLFETLGTKSGLNSALAAHRETHPNTSLVPFGINVSNLSETLTEIERLAQIGKGSYIKLDTVRGGIVAAGGEGHLAIPFGMSRETIEKHILSLTEGSIDYKGVVQMQLQKYRVLSLSSGQDDSGELVPYEAHEQTVDGNTADGALPITDPGMLAELQRFWCDVRGFYESCGVTGDQNLNAMVLSPEDLAAARVLYGEHNVARMVLVDFNYRAVSGTKNAMARYQEDTGQRFSLNEDFRSKGVKVDSRFAANPHLMFAAGNVFGMRPGKGGNFTVVNMGTFTPQAVAQNPRLKTQVIVQCPNARQVVESYETFLQGADARKLAQAHDLPYVEPREVAGMSQRRYELLVREGMHRVIHSNYPYASAQTAFVQGNLWRGSPGSRV